MPDNHKLKITINVAKGNRAQRDASKKHKKTYSNQLKVDPKCSPNNYDNYGGI